MLTVRTTRSIRDSLAVTGLCVLSSACMAAPNPLAPGLRGSVGMPHHGVLTDAAELLVPTDLRNP